MKTWPLSSEDLERIALGAGILGTGGGGNPYLGYLMAREQLRAGNTIEVIDPSDLPPDALVLPLGGIGAPTVGIERIENGTEGVRIVEELERITGRKVDAVIADEIGGANGFAPMIPAAILGLPVVDGDGMGRAFPETQMTTFFIHGQRPSPSLLTDACGNMVAVTNAVSPEQLERILRANTVALGCSALMSTSPLSGEFVSKYAVQGTISQSWQLGDAVLKAQEQKRDPIAAIIEEADAKLLMKGKVTDVVRRIEGGFVRGKLTIAGLGADMNREMTIDIQNEYLVANEGERRLAMVPDLICIVDEETGYPITTEEQRYGLRIAVIIINAPDILRSTKALETVGPRAFGYEFDFDPGATPI